MTRSPSLALSILANDRAAAISTKAWTLLHRSASPDLQRRLQLCVDPCAGGVAVVSGTLDHVFFNRVLDARPTATAGRGARELFRAHGVPRFFVEVDRDDAAHADLEMARAGLVPFHRDWDRFYRDLDEVEPCQDPRIADAHPHQIGTIGALFEAAFDLPAGAGALLTAVVDQPQWQLLTATVDGVIAGAALSFYDGPGCYLAMAATRPEHRRRGIQQAFMKTRLNRAAQAGCRWAATETGVWVPGEANPSWNNMRRMGFDIVGGTRHYTRAGTRWA